MLTLKKQGQDISYSFDLFKGIHDAAISHEAGRTWYATDDQGSLHAAIFVVYDSKSAYYLISSIDPDHRGSGAATLLVRDAITYVSQYTERFDFEGSMIRGVEESFRKFGAIQMPYFSITRNNLPRIVRVFASRPKIRNIVGTLTGTR
jgi:GNAT superfamily N-acetyltransferase